MPSPSVNSRAGIGGPKTVEGKMRSARNALKHGLATSQPVVLDFETSEAWEAFQTSMIESLHPVTSMERRLAEEIALTLWRQRRIPLYEAALASARVEVAEMRWEEYAHRYPEESPEHLAEVLQSSITRSLLHDDGESQHVIRYEAHLDRKLTRLFRELGNLQKTRNCETNSPPPPPPKPPPKPQNCETNSPPSTEPRNYETNSPPPTEPRNCETKAHALRAPRSHENAELLPPSEHLTEVETQDSPERGARSLVVPLPGTLQGGGAARRQSAAPVNAHGVNARQSVTRAGGKLRQPGTEPLARPFLPGVKGQCRAIHAGGGSTLTRAGVDPSTNMIDVSKNTGLLNQSYFHDNSPPAPNHPSSLTPQPLTAPNHPSSFPLQPSFEPSPCLGVSVVKIPPEAQNCKTNSPVAPIHPSSFPLQPSPCPSPVSGSPWEISVVKRELGQTPVEQLLADYHQSSAFQDPVTCRAIIIALVGLLPLSPKEKSWLATARGYLAGSITTEDLEQVEAEAWQSLEGRECKHSNPAVNQTRAVICTLSPTLAAGEELKDFTLVSRFFVGAGGDQAWPIRLLASTLPDPP